MIKLFLCQSPYNFFQTTYNISHLVLEAKKKGLKSLILLEKNSISGFLEFYYECKKHNIKPIVCLEVKIENNLFYFFPLNKLGFNKIIKISNTCFFKNKTIKLKDLDLNENIVFFSSTEIKNDNSKLTLSSKILSSYKGKLNDYLVVNKLSRNDDKVLLVLSKIGNIENYSNLYSLNDIKVENTASFLESINLNLESKPISLPKIYHNQNWDFFRSLCIKGLKARFKTSIVPKKYYDRLLKELEIIKKRHFESYFLVFYDLVQFCFSEGILIGPGRGSAAASLVAYCLFITNVDPIKYNLIFERFLSPMRKELPDIDLDIEDLNRDKVIYYLCERFGIERIANITTFSTFKLKGAFREVAKIIGLNNIIIKDVSKYIPFTHDSFSLKDALNASNALLQKYETDEKVKTALDIASRLEGIPRHLSVHAAGVILTDEKMDNILPLYMNKERIPTTQWKMGEIEKWGVPKLDLLGLRNLTIIKMTLITIYQNRHKLVSLNSLNKFDKKVFNLLANAKTQGIFQLESNGMKEVLKKIKPKTIEEIALVSALFRPGANQYIDECALYKKNPYLIKKIHPIIDKILRETYGVFVYQEQVMQIMVKFAGMSYGEADIMRRMISKKSVVGIEKLNAKFLASCKLQGHNLELSTKIWNKIIRFALYGFNKSHAIAYATISYWMAYLKVNFPIEFYTSLLSSFKSDVYKTLIFIANAKSEYDIWVKGPDINLSSKDYLILGNDILAPLTLIRGIGEIIVENIIQERKINGPFKNYINTITRLVRIGISIETILNLIKGGALNSFKENTATQIYNLNKVVNYSKLSKDANIEKPNIVNQVDTITKISKWEFEAIGFHISRSIIQLLELLEKKQDSRKFFMIKHLPHLNLPIIVNVVKIDETKTKKGNPMLVLHLNDGINNEIIYEFKENTINDIKLRLFPGVYSKISLKYSNTKNMFIFNKIIQVYNI